VVTPIGRPFSLRIITCSPRSFSQACAAKGRLVAFDRALEQLPQLLDLYTMLWMRHWAHYQNE